MPKEKRVTEKKIGRYLKRGTGSCPRCSSISIDGESFEMEGVEVSQMVTCIECGLVWTDTYVLARLEIAETEEDL